MKLDYIALDHLTISPANMRARQKPDLANILASVRERGVLVPLLVRPNGGPDHYEIVAGRRRFLAAQAVAEERGEAAALPCGIIEAGDDAAALEASLIENIARLDPDEVTQWETFARLVKEGRSVEAIAATFGVTERLVRRVLALGNLLPRLRTLYRQELIDAGTIRHLTLATKAQQKAWLALYDSPDAYAPTGRALKEWLFGGAAIPTSAAIFDLADYPGPIIADLFGEDSYFGDADAFWALQRAAVEAKRQSYLEDGWSDAIILEPSEHFQPWQFDKRPKSKGGKVYLSLNPRGEVEMHEGWLPEKEARRQERGDAPPMPPRPEVSGPMQTYIDLHRLAAVRAALLGHPGVALRLIVAHAICGSHLWNVKVERQQADREAVAESVETCSSETVFDAKRRDVLALLGLDPDFPTVVHGARGGMVELFRHLLELPDEDVLAILAIVMGETLAVGSGIIETIGLHIGVDMGQVWQADDAFFDLLRDKAVLTAIVAEVAGQPAAEANAGAKGAALKGIIRDCLVGENGRAKVENWVPAWLRFPAKTYLFREAGNAEKSESTSA